MMPVFLLIMFLPLLAAIEVRAEMFALLLVLCCVVAGLTTHPARRHGRRPGNRTSEGNAHGDRGQPASPAR